MIHSAHPFGAAECNLFGAQTHHGEVCATYTSLRVTRLVPNEVLRQAMLDTSAIFVAFANLCSHSVRAKLWPKNDRGRGRGFALALLASASRPHGSEDVVLVDGRRYRWGLTSTRRLRMGSPPIFPPISTPVGFCFWPGRRLTVEQDLQLFEWRRQTFQS